MNKKQSIISIMVKVIVAFIIVTVHNNLNAQLFIVGDTLSTTITYKNIKDTIITSSAPQYNIDIDYDSLNDLHFCMANWSGSPANNGASFTVGQADTLLPFRIQFVCIGNSSIADTLKPGSILDNTLNWNTTARDVYLYWYDSWALPPPGHTTAYGICNRLNTFIGFRKITTNDTLYGWFFFNLSGNYKIRSYALNKVISLGLQDHGIIQNEIAIYPNPCKSILTIETIEKSVIEIANMQGQIVNSLKIKDSKQNLDISYLARGVYIIKAQTDKAITTKKFIKE
jgi:hypothetical protein